MLKKQTFSKPQLAVFVIVFALLGAVIIWRSFASTPVSLPTIYYESESYTGDGGSASNCYQSTWAMGKSPTTPYISPDSYHHAQRYLLVNPNANDGNGHQGKDDWWFAFEHYVDTSTPLTFAGQDDSFFNLHNVAGDSGPNGGIGWGFGSGVSAFHLMYDGSTGSPYMLLENNASGGSHYDLPALSKGQWHQFVIHITFGRTDGTTPRAGAVQLWVDGAKRYDLGNLNILQKAVGPDGKTYIQQWVQLWQGTYIKGAPCNPSNTSPRSGQLVLARIGNTFQQALDDVPTFDTFTGTTHIAGYPDFGNSFSRLASTQRTTADFNIPADLGGSSQPTSLIGDLNNDNSVNIQDLSILLSNYNTASSTADINLDGTVNVLDLSILLSHYGQAGVLQKPSVPTGLTATPGDSSVALKWNANPTIDNVDTYQVYVNGANTNLAVSGTSYTVTGLTNGTSYNFRVSAHNSAGYGDWTTAVSAMPQVTGGGTGQLITFGNFGAGDLSEFSDTSCHSDKVTVHAGGGPNNTNWARFVSDDQTQCYGDTVNVRIHMLGMPNKPAWFNNGGTFWQAQSLRVPSGYGNLATIYGGDEIHGDNGTGVAPAHIGFRNNQWNINAAGSDAEEYARHAFASWNFGGHFASDQVYGGKDYRKQSDWVGGNHSIVKDEWIHFRIGYHFDYTNNNGVGNGWYEAWARWGNMTSWLNIVPRVSNIPLGTTDVDGNGSTIYPMLSMYYPVGNGVTFALDYADGAYSNDYTTLANWQDARLGF